MALGPLTHQITHQQGPLLKHCCLSVAYICYTHPVDNYLCLLWKLFVKSTFFIIHLVMRQAFEKGSR